MNQKKNLALKELIEEYQKMASTSAVPPFDEECYTYSGCNSSIEHIQKVLVNASTNP
jgi:hypothetical protein